MKRYKNLYPQITSFENLYQAFKRAARGKRSQPNVATFEFDLEANLFRLQEAAFVACSLPRRAGRPRHSRMRGGARICAGECLRVRASPARSRSRLLS